jgi:phosphoesterase RecJ-like protein
VRPWKVASNVYESWPLQRLRLLGAALDTLELGCDGRLATMVVSDETLSACGATVDMTEGFVNYGRMVAGVEVAALLRQQGPGAGEYRLSLRSRGRVDVSAVVTALGGGGHPNASGGTLRGTLEEVRRRLEALVQEALDALAPEDEDCWSRS